MDQKFYEGVWPSGTGSTIVAASPLVVGSTGYGIVKLIEIVNADK